MISWLQSSKTRTPYTGELAVRCTSVLKEFGQGQAKIRVIHGIDLEIPFGMKTFLIGPSGCGKTTLVSLMAGLLNPTSGKIEVLGRDITRLRGGRLVRFRSEAMGFIFQQFNLLPALTAAENAAVPLVVQGVSFSTAIRAANAMLDKLQMGQHRRKFPNQLSGGQQQRIAIARSLIHQPRIVFCDEPTASLDAESGRTVMELLNELATDATRAVILVTHDDRIFKYADRIVRLSDGRVESIEQNGIPIL